MNRAATALVGVAMVVGSALLFGGTAHAGTATSSCNGAVPCAIQYKFYGGDTVTVGNDRMGSYRQFCDGPRDESCIGQTNYATVPVTWSVQGNGTVCITGYLTQGRYTPVGTC